MLGFGVSMRSLGCASKEVKVSGCSSNDVAGVDDAALACSVQGLRMSVEGIWFGLLGLGLRRV